MLCISSSLLLYYTCSGHAVDVVLKTMLALASYLHRLPAGDSRGEKLAVLYEEWAGSNESWRRSNLILQMSTRESRKVRGGRRWLTEMEIAAKYNSPEIASDIIKAKLENEVLRQTSVRCHPDLPDKPEMNQYLIWDFGVETDERDEILESLFRVEDGSDSEEEADDSSNKKKAKKNKKTSKTDGKSKKKKRRSSSSSSSAPSSLKSTSSSESTKKKRKNEKKKKNKKHGKNKKSSEDDSGSEASVPKLTDAQKRKAERDQARKDEQEKKRLAKEEEKERKDKEKEEKRDRERQEKEAKREAEKDKEKKRNLIKKEPLV